MDLETSPWCNFVDEVKGLVGPELGHFHHFLLDQALVGLKICAVVLQDDIPFLLGEQPCSTSLEQLRQYCSSLRTMVRDSCLRNYTAHHLLSALHIRIDPRRDIGYCSREGKHQVGHSDVGRMPSRMALPMEQQVLEVHYMGHHMGHRTEHYRWCAVEGYFVGIWEVVEFQDSLPALLFLGLHWTIS